jgi:hypothetical protein
MTRGCGWDGWLSAFRNRRLAASEVNRGAGGIDGPIQVAPTALHSNVGLVHAPRFVGRPEVSPQPLLQFGTVTLYPVPNGGVIEKLFDIPKRQGVPKVPAHRAENQDGFSLPHVTIAGRVAISGSLQADQPSYSGKLQHIRFGDYQLRG